MKSSNIRLATPLTLRELIHMLLRSYTWKKDNSSFEENFSGQKPAAISTPKKKKSSIEAVVAGDVSTVTAHISMCCKYKVA